MVWPLHASRVRAPRVPGFARVCGAARPGLCTIAAVAAVSLAACERPTGNVVASWQLVWSDEFDGPAGRSPDPARWRYDVGTDWGNAQLEFDTNRPENASLDGSGHLALTARKEPWQGREYTSARINTAGLFETRGGRFEARILMPGGQGLWPAFWLLGADFGTVGWPGCGEIDVMEFLGQQPGTVYGTVHGPGYFGAEGVGRRFDLLQGRFDTSYHTFTLEWGTDYVTWLVDGTPYQTLGPADLPGPWVFDHSFFMILDLAVGGTFVGPPDSSTTFPQSMLVDWVRVYQRTL